jgi:hypothetical protein
MKIARLFLGLTLICTAALKAQNIGIGTQTPASSALLDVSSANKGLLAPRLSLTNTGTASPVTSPAEGLLVYNTNAAVAGFGALGKGFYFWTGFRWQKIVGGTEAWSLTGNAFTDTAVHFIGTTDNRALMFRVGNLPAGRIEINSENLFLGYEAGRNNVFDNANFAGEQNTFIGAGAGKSNKDGSSNTYIGTESGRSLSSSSGNTMVGAFTGASNSTGQFNTNVGYVAGGGIGDGSRNTAIGYQAGSFMGDNQGAQGNVTVGFEAGTSLRNGEGNVVIGRHAGNGNFSQSGIGSYNVYIGDSSAPNSLLAQRNVAIGRRSLRNITNGSRNVAIGDSAGSNLLTGSGNVFIGDGAKGSITSLENAAAIGNRAFVSVNNAVVLGGVAGTNGAAENANVGIGLTNPTYRLHIRDGVGSGVLASGNSLLVLDKTGGPNYLSILKGNFESGLVFGRAGSNQPPFDGGIFYNVGSTPGGMQFRNKGGFTRMVIHDNGNISMGNLNDAYKLYVQAGLPTGITPNANSTVVIEKTAASNYLSLLADNDRESGILFGRAGATSAAANGGIIYNPAALPSGMHFRTGGNANRMVIDEIGDVGIGTSAPEYRLHVVTADAQNFGYRQGIVVKNTATGVDGQGNINTGEAAISFKNAGENGTGINQWMVGLNQNRNLAFAYGPDFAGGSITKRLLDSTGNLGIGTTAPSQKLHVIGNILATGTITPSDERYKKNFSNLSSVLPMLMAIHPMYYQYNKEAFPEMGFGDERTLGLVAQELEKSFPELVVTDQKGYKAVDYSKLSVVLLRALQEQQEIVQANQDALKQMEQRLQKLEKDK